MILSLVLGSIIAIFILLVIFLITTIAENDLEYGGTIYCILTIITTVMLIWYHPYYVQEDIAKLRVECTYNLDNILTLANNLNEKAVIRTNNDSIIIDVANFKQSTITSQVYIEYVKTINGYNEQLAELKMKSQKGFSYRLWYGRYPDIPDDLKFFKIKF